MGKRLLGGVLGTMVAVAVACSSSSGGSTAVSTDDGGVCANVTTASRFPDGDPNGNADPFGAKAAGQARAGKITDASMVVRVPDARNRVNVGDYVIANDKIVAYVASARPTDGYVPFGGKVITIDVVGDDGKPLGLSEYGETLIAFSHQAITPDNVTVMNDGSDGNPAIIRAQGIMADIPFLDPFKAIFPKAYPYPIAIDYVLAPGSEKLGVRMSIMNTSPTDTETFMGQQMLGMFHSYRGQMFTEGAGFSDPSAPTVPWVGYDGGTMSIGIRGAGGSPMTFGADVSGFQYYTLSGYSVPPCGTTTADYAEIIPAPGGMDSLRTTIARIDGDTSLRAIAGTVKEAGGAVVPGAYVHATSADGTTYISRTTTDTNGAFTVNVPAGAVSLYATAPGYAITSAVSVADGATTASIVEPTHGTIHVTATDATSSVALPVRVQVIPQPALAAIPASFGINTEDNGRLWQSFAMNGDISLNVPPGSHQVVVSRGYEYELSKQTVAVTAGVTTPIAASLLHSVDSTGVMCADFHIHSFFSVDAGDTVVDKVKSAIADGLEIPVSSEHEWIIDFQPIIQSLGVTNWAFGFPSEELTTFTFGHFGVVPKMPTTDPSVVNLGAVPWVGEMPGQIFDAVHALPEQPILIINHPIGTSFMGYFSAAEFNNTTATGTPGMWSDHFDAVEVWNGSDFASNLTDSVASWFALIASGKNAWGIGNSDSHHIKSSPVGYPRNCIQFGTDDPTTLTANKVRDQVGAGAFNVSGGLYMTATGPDGKGPGQTSTAGTYSVTVQAPSWLTASTLEAYVDSVNSPQIIPLTDSGTGPAHVYKASVNIQPGSGTTRHFVIFHAKGTTDLAPLQPGRNPFAVTNPIFF